MTDGPPGEGAGAARKPVERPFPWKQRTPWGRCPQTPEFGAWGAWKVSLPKQRPKGSGCLWKCRTWRSCGQAVDNASVAHRLPTIAWTTAGLLPPVVHRSLDNSVAAQAARVHGGKRIRRRLSRSEPQGGVIHNSTDFQKNSNIYINNSILQNSPSLRDGAKTGFYKRQKSTFFKAQSGLVNGEYLTSRPPENTLRTRCNSTLRGRLKPPRQEGDLPCPGLTASKQRQRMSRVRRNNACFAGR